MSNLVRTTPTFSPTRIERQTEQALQRVNAAQSLTSAQEVAKVETVAQVTEAALLAVSHLSALEEMLVGRTPRAEERLRHIVDAGTLNITQVVFKVNRSFS